MNFTMTYISIQNLTKYEKKNMEKKKYHTYKFDMRVVCATVKK